MNLADVRSHDSEDLTQRNEVDPLEFDFWHPEPWIPTVDDKVLTVNGVMFGETHGSLATFMEQLSISTSIVRATPIPFETLD